MISPDSCDQLVAGNYDILVNEPAPKLKSILTNFLERFRQQKTCSYAEEFKLLKEFSKSLKEDKSNLVEGELEVNLRKNRYKDIIPFSHTRVILSNHQSQVGIGEQTDQKAAAVPGADYINANYVRGPSGSKRAYIACQGPLPSTLNDFWRMIWECGVSVIVMACNQHESGEPKCELYWPEEPDSSSTYGNIQVKLVKVRQICPDFLIRKFSVKLFATEPAAAADLKEPEATQTATESGLNQEQNNNNNPSNATKQEQQQNQQQQRRVLFERTICQFHYTTWPDHGVPAAVEPILELVRLVRDVQPAENKPILVHCSAGCGRTGTICCIDFVWGLLRRGTLDSSFDLCKIISEMRQQRMSMVQTLEQYILCHKAVAALFINQLALMESHLYADEEEGAEVGEEQQQGGGGGQVDAEAGADEERELASHGSKQAGLVLQDQSFEGPVFI